MRALESAEKDMQIIRRIDKNSHVSYMAPGIHKTNARYWDTLVIIMLKLGLLRTTVTTQQTEINLTGRKITILLLTIQWKNNPARKNKVSNEEKSHENIESELNEKILFQIDNMSLDDNREKTNDVNVRLNVNSKIHMRLKSRIL